MLTLFIRFLLIISLLSVFSFAEDLEDGWKAYENKDNKTLGSVFLKSAHQGNTVAQCRLGFTYEHGDGVAQDYTIAIHWYSKSAKQGNAEAQFRLGTMYYNGKGVMKNNMIAYALYSLNNDTGSLRDLTAQDLTTEQINQAQALTREPKKLWALIEKTQKIKNEQ
ncbi:MAG: tetratricopeptide repeat protein [Sulfuricurvum sp.]|nr:tetratricopeptide repeat protein [Sulfuricurvum sp.]